MYVQVQSWRVAKHRLANMLLLALRIRTQKTENVLLSHSVSQTSHTMPWQSISDISLVLSSCPLCPPDCPSFFPSPHLCTVGSCMLCPGAFCASACDLYEGRALLVVGTLVLQPLPVARNAGDLLAVEIGNWTGLSACQASHKSMTRPKPTWVASRVIGRVNAILLDARKELTLLLHITARRQHPSNSTSAGKQASINIPQSSAPCTCSWPGKTAHSPSSARPTTPAPRTPASPAPASARGPAAPRSSAGPRRPCSAPPPRPCRPPGS